jgi:predicted esterase
MERADVWETPLDGLTLAEFEVEVDGERVPGMVYVPSEHETPMPLVLLQHPATSSKDDYFVAEPARLWANRGWIVGGFDAPFHGDRDPFDPMALLRDRELLASAGQRYTKELAAILRMLAERYPVDAGRLGFVGYSLGSMFGIPAVAAHGGFRAAVFCLVGEGGLVGPATGPDSVLPALRSTAVRIVAKTRDELIPREATERLYDALPGEKDIVWLPGGHFEIGPDVIGAAEQWLLRWLA